MEMLKGVQIYKIMSIVKKDARRGSRRTISGGEGRKREGNRDDQ
jgi:hypothetical protein